jgi:hypothetical protein
MPTELDQLKARLAHLEGHTPKLPGPQAIGAGRLGGLKDATPPTETDQQIASQLVGHDEIARPTREDRAARAELLDRLDPERRQRVLELAEATRKEREPLLHPPPLAAPVQPWMPADWLRTKETRRFVDGSTEVVDSATGEVIQERQRTAPDVAREILSRVVGRSNKPAPSATVTKGRTSAPRTG